MMAMLDLLPSGHGIVIYHLRWWIPDLLLGPICDDPDTVLRCREGKIGGSVDQCTTSWTVNGHKAEDSCFLHSWANVRVTP